MDVGNLTMNALSCLDDVVAALENNVNLNQSKKLLYFVAYGKWEGNDKILIEVELKDIISEILQLDYSLEELDELLKDICSKINKQVEYLAIAQQIIHNLSPLYAEASEEFSATSTSLRNQTNTGDLSESDPQVTVNTKLSDSDWSDPSLHNDLFEVRLKLVQRTNPLRVKILIFSAINNQAFTFSDPEWSALKKYRLDQLLQKLLEKCPHQKNLEKLLYKTAKTFTNKNESIQVASAIVKYLSPLYVNSDRKLTENSVSQGSVSNNSDSTTENTSVKSDVDRTGGLTDQESDRSNNGTNYSLAKELENFPQEQYPGQIYASEDDVTIPELHSNIFEQIQKRHHRGEHQGDSPNNSQPASQVGKLRITDSLKRQLALEEEIQNLVNYHVNRLMQEIETGLSQLENFLDDRLWHEQTVKASSLKYQSLKQMISQMQGNTSKYLDLLNQMQSAEIQQIQPSQPNQTTPTTENSPDRDQESDGDQLPAKVMELAKQGHAKAIAALMNHILKGRGINTLATIKHDCLHVVLESEQKPNQKASINLVQKNVVPLQLDSITKVKVHWRKTGSKSPEWSHEFTYTVDGNHQP